MTGERHLRAVAPQPITTAQIADMPGAYTVRRPGVLTAEAIMHRGDSGDWYVMYGHQPSPAPVGEWKASATLPGRLDDPQAGRAAIELVDAWSTGAPGWPDLLARSIMHGEPVESIARLHRPTGTVQWWCGGERVPGPYDSMPNPYWLACPTVRLLAEAFDVRLPAPPAAPDGY